MANLPIDRQEYLLRRITNTKLSATAAFRKKANDKKLLNLDNDDLYILLRTRNLPINKRWRKRAPKEYRRLLRLLSLENLIVGRDCIPGYIPNSANPKEIHGDPIPSPQMPIIE